MTKPNWDKINAKMRHKNQLLSELERAAGEVRYGPNGIRGEAHTYEVYREIIGVCAAINQEKGVGR